MTPEYSVTLDLINSKYYLTFRTFKSNYWLSVFNNRSITSDLIWAKIDSSFALVSDAFANQLTDYYNIKLFPDSLFETNYSQVYDGTTYVFINDSFSREIRETDLPLHKSYSALILKFENMANDLKKKTFNEKDHLLFSPSQGQ